MDLHCKLILAPLQDRFRGFLELQVSLVVAGFAENEQNALVSPV